MNVYQFLYHATFRQNLTSIRKGGLIPGKTKNWSDSNGQCLYFSSDPEEALDFCECAEEVSESKYESGIVMLAIPKRSFNSAYLAIDRNAQGNGYHSYEYRSNVNLNNIYIAVREGSDVKIKGKLSEVKRVPAYSD